MVHYKRLKTIEQTRKAKTVDTVAYERLSFTRGSSYMCKSLNLYWENLSVLGSIRLSPEGEVNSCGLPRREALKYTAISRKVVEKKCTRQFRKVLWMGFSSRFFKEIWDNSKRGHGLMFANAKGKRQKQVRRLQCQESVLIISHNTFRNFRVHSFSDNLSRNNCISSAVHRPWGG